MSNFHEQMARIVTWCVFAVEILTFDFFKRGTKFIRIFFCMKVKLLKWSDAVRRNSPPFV